MSNRLNRLARRGFTLIELMVVVALVLILATLGGLKYMRYREFTAGVACNALLQEIQNARIACLVVNGKLEANSCRPSYLKPYMSSADIYKVVNSGGSPTIGGAFFCPLTSANGWMAKSIRLDTQGDVSWDATSKIEYLPVCDNYNDYGKKFSGYELHKLGGYRYQY